MASRLVFHYCVSSVWGKRQLNWAYVFECWQMTTGHPAGSAEMPLNDILYRKDSGAISKYDAHLPATNYREGARSGSGASLQMKWWLLPAQKMEEHYQSRATISDLANYLKYQHLFWGIGCTAANASALRLQRYFCHESKPIITPWPDGGPKAWSHFLCVDGLNARKEKNIYIWLAL
ncbi:hypothetical protein PoB_002943400 [Plakobranchus ocellatus]|uniref:Uncharacterized protein n=1 Tax=Plakobranchus ocellatus TaxID=259542 RepID=A0AAV4A5H2_9GAST|nr:hypothetical protein PoB_002943400 [Plakobranchus ocellatus]